MSTDNLVDFFTHDHRSCDETWIAVETAAEAGDQAAMASAYAQFHGELAHHFKMEEEVLFPAFEEATGMTQGPTSMMRTEHEQMRGVLRQMDKACADGDGDGLTDLGDTLLMIIQQHNTKEEGMLYPAASEHIPTPWAELKARIDAL